MRRSSVSAPAPSDATIAVRIGQWTSYSASPLWLHPLPGVTPVAPKTSEIFSCPPSSSTSGLSSAPSPTTVIFEASAETVSAEATAGTARSRSAATSDARSRRANMDPSVDWIKVRHGTAGAGTLAQVAEVA